MTVVSGLPRSGTSMMMQALEAGGIPVLTDEIRKEDTDNPKGYYEFEPVKKTREDASWVPRAVGKAVKIIYRLVYDLPDDFQYRVIFLQREMREVLVSQQKMLKRSGKTGANVEDDKLERLFVSHLSQFDKWIAEKENFSILYIRHRDMIENARNQCEKIGQFLGGFFDTASAAAVVDPILYRNKKEKIGKSA